MNTPSVSAIAAALGTALTAVGIRNLPYLSDTFTPPVALIAIEKVDYHGAFSNADVEHTFTVYLIISRADDRAAMAAMEDYMSQAGALSVAAAIEADRTLGGVVSTLIVRESGPPSAVDIGGSPYISLPFTVEIHA